jgi:hypothetical protein
MDSALERVDIPGFRLGRRFVALDIDLAIFNHQETDDLHILHGQDYRTGLNTPAPWTSSAMKPFRNVARSLCDVALRIGEAQGGVVATPRDDLLADGQSEHLKRLRTELAAWLAVAPGVAGLWALVADLEASGEMTTEKKARPGGADIPGHVLIGEGWGDEKNHRNYAPAQGPKQLAALGLAGKPR